MAFLFKIIRISIGFIFKRFSFKRSWFWNILRNRD